MKDNSTALHIKHELETVYDIPFEVERTGFFDDIAFDIRPYSIDKELFKIHIRFKNNLRMVVEILPEDYAVFSIKDMSCASKEKKYIFTEYAKQLRARRAKIEFYINNAVCDPENIETWPKDWNDYRMRITRSPIIEEDEELDEERLSVSWALIVTGMFLSLLDVVCKDDVNYEGGLTRIEVNRYERNPVNRELCIAANGYNCRICGFNFEEKYGVLGRHFIHVHHIIPVSKMTSEYEINPVIDMIPVCPNCHAMLHKTDPPLSPEDLINRMKR